MRYLTVLFYFLFTFFATAQKLVLTKSGEFFGLLNPVTYELKVPRLYKTLEAASDGTFLGAAGNLHVYFDENGKEFLRFNDGKRYLLFSEGIAMFTDFQTSKEEAGTILHIGYINKKGNIVIAAQYKEGQDFHEGIAVVKDFQDNIFLINQEGKKITNLGTKYITASDSKDGLLFAYLKSENDKQASKIQYIDRTGKVIIDLTSNKEITEANPFSQGIAVVGKSKAPTGNEHGDDIYTDAAYGVIDHAGKFILPIEYQTITIEPQGTILTTKATGAQVLFDRQGKEIIKGYYKISPLMGGYFRMVQANSQEAGWGVIAVTNQNKVIVPLKYQEIFYNGASDFWAVEKWTFIKDKRFTNDIGDSPTYAKEGKVSIYTHSKIVADENTWRIYDKNTEAPFYGSVLRETLMPFEYNGKWGLIEGFEIKALGYDSIASFQEVYPNDLIAVKKRGKWGYINPKGEMVINPAYDQATMFALAYTPVRKGNKWGLINKNNKPITAFEFDEIVSFENTNLMKFKKDAHEGLLNEKGKIVIPAVFQTIQYNNEKSFIGKNMEGKYGISSLENKIVLPYLYDNIRPFKNAYKVKKGFLVGLIDAEYNETLPTQYEDIKIAEKGNWYIYKNKKMGLANAKGEPLIAPEYDTIEIYTKFIEITKNGKKGLLKTDYAPFIPCEYETIELYSHSFTPEKPFTIFKQNGLKGVFDINGKVAIPAIYEELENYIKDHFIVKKAGKWGVITTQGNEFIKIEYDEVYPLYTEKGAYFRLTQNKKEALISSKGEVIIPMKYDELGHFTLDMNLNMGVKQKGKWGFINSKQKMVIKPIYDDVQMFQKIGENAYNVVKKGNLYGVIDAKGKTIVPFLYDALNLPQLPTEHIMAVKAGKVLKLSMQGREIVE